VTSSASIPRVLLHVEGAAVLALVVFLYAKNDESWILFAVLLLAPDVGMLGYLANRRVGAIAYNVFHAYPVPALVAALGVQTDRPMVIALGLIWFAHIGLDRMLGYGLKYPTDFKDTHLGRV
jgi:Domain of unknown function (DUF4260)